MGLKGGAIAPFIDGYRESNISLCVIERRNVLLACECGGLFGVELERSAEDRGAVDRLIESASELERKSDCPGAGH